MPYADNDMLWQPTPEFKDDIRGRNAKIDYKAKELDRYKNGFGYLSGSQYFYMYSGGKLKISDALINPMYRDWDEKIINLYTECAYPKKDKETEITPPIKDMLIIKRWQFGLSSFFGASEPTRRCVINPLATNIITSYNDATLSQLKVDKLYPFFKNVVDFIPANYYDPSDFVLFPQEGTSINKNKQGATIWFPETNKDKNSVTKLAGKRSEYNFLDEYLLHRFSEQLRLLMKPITSEQKQDELGNWDTLKFGILVMGGSCNTINMNSIFKLEDLYHNPPDNLEIVFIPGWACLKMNKYGETNEQAGIDWIMQQRDKLRKGRRWADLAMFIKQYPLTIEEIIEVEQSDMFGTNVLHNVNKGRKYGWSKEKTIVQCFLKEDNGVIFHDYNPDGDVWIDQLPIPGHTYIGGIDAIDGSGNPDNDKNSSFCCTIKDITTNKYVALLLFRTNEPMVMHDKWHRLCRYYKSERFETGAHCFGEKQRLYTLLTICQKEGTLSLIEKDPERKDFKGEMDRGIFKSSDEIVQLLNLYLENNFIPFKQFNDTFPKKTDVRDALVQTELFSSYLNVDTYQTEAQPKEKTLVYKRDGRGFKQAVWE